MLSNPFISIINQSLPEPQASLLNGILFGIRANLPQDLYQALITTGTIHIIALSGQNISILTNIVSKITLPLGRRLSAIFSIFILIVFVIFVGLEPTIIRAAIMGCISLLAVYFGRQSWSLLSLILAAGIMLIVNPDYIAQLSFKLSFLATLGIIIFGRYHNQKSQNAWQEIGRELKINFRTTISAQIFTVPLIIWKFRRLSLIAPLTNIIIGWTIGPIMSLGLLLCLAGWVFLPLGQVVGWIVWVLLTFVIESVQLTAKIPFASIGL